MTQETSRDKTRKDDEINKMRRDETRLDRDEKINGTRRDDTRRDYTRLEESRDEK